MKNPLDAKFADRRSEPRETAAGRVSLAFADPLPCQVEAELIDVSRNGFRCRHDYNRLRTGQSVRFHHPMAAGEARVMWNRILEGGIESGFFVL